jgi:hypothetical protein
MNGDLLQKPSFSSHNQSPPQLLGDLLAHQGHKPPPFMSRHQLCLLASTNKPDQPFLEQGTAASWHSVSVCGDLEYSVCRPQHKKRTEREPLP